MAQTLDGRRVAFLVANEGIEEVELTEPWKAIATTGSEPVLLAPKPGRVQAFNHLDKGDTFPVDKVVADARVEDYAALVLPGGVANPDQLRMHEPAVALVRAFADAGTPIAVICHGPWTLVEADVVRGRELTSWPSLQTDIRNAGGKWTDAEVVIDRNGPGPIISSRKPDDLPVFCRSLLQELMARTSTGAGTR